MLVPYNPVPGLRRSPPLHNNIYNLEYLSSIKMQSKKDGAVKKDSEVKILSSKFQHHDAGKKNRKKSRKDEHDKDPKVEAERKRQELEEVFFCFYLLSFNFYFI